MELARAIASKDNPLTARVMVNRIWQHHFGEGIVRTPSDFGARGEPPTHPELLDWLASKFMDEGWSIKKMHRLMLLSNTYQQESGGDAARKAADPENRLLSHMNRLRLEYEALRDSLLFAAGDLDPRMGGKGDDMTNPRPPFSHRRTVYGFIDRQNLPGVLRTFDFASPDATVGDAPRHDHAAAGAVPDEQRLRGGAGQGVRRPARRGRPVRTRPASTAWSASPTAGRRNPTRSRWVCVS